MPPPAILPLISGRSPGRFEERPSDQIARDARATRRVAYIERAH
jgi:hypothetical protein